MEKITKRDYFAIRILQAMIPSEDEAYACCSEGMVNEAYRIAELMCEHHGGGIKNVPDIPKEKSVVEILKANIKFHQAEFFSEQKDEERYFNEGAAVAFSECLELLLAQKEEIGGR